MCSSFTKKPQHAQNHQNKVFYFVGRGSEMKKEKEKGGTPAGPKDRTYKGNSLTEDTPRDAVTNALRLHLHDFAYKTIEIKIILFCLLVLGEGERIYIGIPLELSLTIDLSCTLLMLYHSK